MSSTTLDPSPRLRKHFDAYATVSDAHRTTHKELKQYAETVAHMRSILASVQGIPDTYGKRLMDKAEMSHLRQEQDDMMRMLRKTRRELGLKTEGQARTNAETNRLQKQPDSVTDESESMSDESHAEGSTASETSESVRNVGSETEASTERETEESVGSETKESTESTNEADKESEADESVDSTNEEQQKSNADESVDSTDKTDKESEADESVDNTDKTDKESEADESVDSTNEEQQKSNADESVDSADETNKDSKADESVDSADEAKQKSEADSASDDASSSSKQHMPPSSHTSAPALSRSRPNATPTLNSRRDKGVPSKKTAPSAKAAEDIRILPLPTAHHRAHDARLKRLKMLQARTGRPVFVHGMERDEGTGGRKRRQRRDVRRRWRK